MDEAPENELMQARRTMEAAAQKTPAGQLESFAPYLCASLAFWRLEEQAARTAGNMAAELAAVAERLAYEEKFRAVAGRSFHTITDAVSYEAICALPNPK